MARRLPSHARALALGLLLVASHDARGASRPSLRQRLVSLVRRTPQRPSLPVRRAFDFEPARANLRGRDLFQRFRVPERAERLGGAQLAPDTALIVLEAHGARRAFLVSQMAYYHLAQGTLRGEPFAVSF